MTMSIGSTSFRFLLLLVSLLLGVQGIVLFLDIIMETLFFDELAAFLISSALVWIVARLRKYDNSVVARLLLKGASGLLALQAFVIGLDFTITTYFFDEVANVVINGALGWIVMRQKNNLKGK